MRLTKVGEKVFMTIEGIFLGLAIALSFNYTLLAFISLVGLCINSYLISKYMK